MYARSLPFLSVFPSSSLPLLLSLSQAQARCHRIGQNKMVKVYRLITTNSYEREMFDRLEGGDHDEQGASVLTNKIIVQH